MGDASTLICHDVYSGRRLEMQPVRLLRRIDGRRVVYEGLCGEAESIIKLFLSRVHGKRHWAREKRGLEELARRGVRTARILAGGRTPEGHYMLALEKIQHADDLFSLSEKHIGIPQEAWDQLFQQLAVMHEAGVCQRDLHLGNFLWDGREIYALDPAMMSFSRGPLDKSRSMRQLAVLLSSFTPRQNREELVRMYYRMRSWQWNEAECRRIEELCGRLRLKSIETGLKKTLRTSKRFFKQQDTNWRGVFDRTLFEGTDIKSFMQGLDRLMESGQILKRGNTCFVSRVRINGRDAVIKRYNRKGRLHSLRHSLKGSRAKKCWLFGHRLTAVGVPCAKPLAFVEQRRCGILWQSYIINEFVEGINIQHYLAEASQIQQRKVTDETMALLQRLAANKMTHGDLKPSNLLIFNDSPVLIDLDSMKRFRCKYVHAINTKKMLNDSRLKALLKS